MDTRVCRYFVVLCQLGNYSAAARELSITPQGLNNAIHRLEKELDVLLVDGRFGPIHPTAHGKAFLDYALKAMEEEDRMLAELDAITQRSSGPIRVSCAVGLLSDGLRRWIGAFDRTRQGSTYVEFQGELPDVICEDELFEGRCDFSVIVDPIDPNPLLKSIPIAHDCHFLWVNRMNPLSTREVIDVEDLEGQSIMSVGAEYHASSYLLDLVKSRGVHASVEFTSEMIKVCEYALANEGLGLTARSHVEAIGSSRLYGIPFPEFPVKISMFYRADRVLSEADMRFLDYMRSYQQPYV